MNYKQLYMTQKRNAKKRDINFLLSFDEWLSIWTQSGQLANRGRGKNKYHMCRNNDTGAYEIGNVYIGTSEHNAGLPHIDKSKSIEQKQKMSKAQLGKKKSIIAIANNAISQLSRPKYDCPHCNKLISGMGNLKQHIASKHLEIL